VLTHLLSHDFECTLLRDTCESDHLHNLRSLKTFYKRIKDYIETSLMLDYSKTLVVLAGCFREFLKQEK
jgi:hypothetical protein